MPRHANKLFYNASFVELLVAFASTDLDKEYELLYENRLGSELPKKKKNKVVKGLALLLPSRSIKCAKRQKILFQYKVLEAS